MGGMPAYWSSSGSSHSAPPIPWELARDDVLGDLWDAKRTLG